MGLGRFRLFLLLCDHFGKFVKQNLSDATEYLVHPKHVDNVEQHARPYQHVPVSW